MLSGKFCNILVALNKKFKISRAGRIFDFLVWKVSEEKVYFNTFYNNASRV